jgi:hypothetical protein
MAYQDYLLANFATNLQGYWPMGEASGATIDDASTNARDGTMLNAPASYGNAGPGTGHGNAIRFDEDSRIQLEAVPGSTFRMANFTVSCWFRRIGNSTATTSIGTDVGDAALEPMVTKGYGIGESAGDNVGFFLGVGRTGTVLFGGYEESTGPGHAVRGSTSVADALWHFAVFTYDGTNLRMYLDGAADATAVAASPGPDSGAACLAAIGTGMNKANTTCVGDFNGEICHVAIWSAALSAANILALYSEVYPPEPTATLIGDSPRLMGTTIQVQLADPNGAGIDHDSVTSADVKVWRNGTLQVPETDYSFSYDSGSSVITLTRIGGNWTAASYAIRLNEGQT